MDNGWMKLRNKLSLEYRHGVTQFLEFAKFHVDAYERLRCPCKRCLNLNWNSLEGVELTSAYYWNIHNCGTTSADFNDQAMNMFVEHQMLTTFKEFWTDCHRHFKKYSDPEEARANPPNALVGRDEDWHFICDHYISHAFQLAERKGESVDRVELFRETHVRAGTFVSQAAEDVHMVVSHSMRIKYAIRCWVDDQATQKALVEDPSRRPTERRVQTVRRHLVRSPQKKRFNYKLNFMKLWNGLK
ncbi:CACTA en-spm transposon protein [Cucumis melo var. makuwa]|uniref:CACTA en-spm transposon protein n=1 Tax=Cucumis melo var. makuwa TaxID=1194695 RepID=A0A5A7U8S2_CUCMM|nr:CACTA en-spm transposon protein [Cucumis melo var. makuwa]TYK05117.1 CACTA en-spm transposon protein [Cucumis melo var. makuwa]